MFGLDPARLTLTLAAACVLAAIHVFSHSHSVLSDEPRSPVLSFAGGVAIAFAFLRLLPALARTEPAVDRSFGVSSDAPLSVPFAIAALSLLVFYGLDRLMKRSRREQTRASGQDRTALGAYLAHMPLYVLLNATVGFLLLDQAEIGMRPLVLFASAKSSAFLVIDHAFHDDHKQTYDRGGNWVVAAAVFGGLGLRAGWTPPEFVVRLMQAVLFGAIVVNVLKEETPPERMARFWPFGLGAACYVALLLVSS